MTPEQWADSVSTDMWNRFNRGEPPSEQGELRRSYVDVIRKAVAEERDRCAKVADDEYKTAMAADFLTPEIHAQAIVATRIGSAIRINF